MQSGYVDGKSDHLKQVIYTRFRVNWQLVVSGVNLVFRNQNIYGLHGATIDYW